MGNLLWKLAMILALLPFLQYANAATGYGTSTVSIAQAAVTIGAGHSAVVGYTVSLATGNTWGTTAVVTDSATLASQGITTSVTPSGMTDPTYSGNLTINVASTAKPGKYSLTLAASGDDPSTQNATMSITVPNSTASTTALTTTSVSGSGSGYPPSGSYALSATAGILIAVLAVIIIATAVAAWKMKAPDARKIIIGTALILIGIAVWLYGDYTGGMATYIWSGVAAIILGTVIWLWGDHNAKEGKPLIILGVILIIIGTVVWLYADYYAGGNLTYIWTGVALLIIGTIVWLVGDRKAKIV